MLASFLGKPPVLYDSHTHTPLCKHAEGHPREYAARARQRGLKGITITCHNPIPDGWARHVRMDMDQWDEYIDLVEEARQEYEGRVDVRLGIESDCVPGMEGWLEELHARTPLSFIIGSVHPQLKEYKEAYFTGDHVAFFRQYFDHLAWVAETGLVDCISHPDLVKNIFPAQWDIDAVMDDIKRALDRIAETNTAMELNTSGLYKAIPEMNPAPSMLIQMAQRGIPVVLGSDSHTPGRVGEGFEEGLDMLQQCGYTEVSFYIDRQRQNVSIPVARDSLKRR